MNNYIFNETSLEKEFYLVFLCGAEYNKKNSSDDKRVVLKNYLKNIPKVFPIILEENFSLAKSQKGYLAYDDIYMKSLLDIEKLMCFFSDYIIIIHETLSTAGELGVFASNPEFSDKILLLIPDKYQVEEQKMNGFLNLAFTNKTIKVDREYFYPKIKINHISQNLISYHTFFLNNNIGTNLSNNIKKYIDKCMEESSINLVLNKTKNPEVYNANHSQYYINKEDKIVKIFLTGNEILFQIISFFSESEIVNIIREMPDIKQLVLFAKKLYVDTIINTICEKEKIIKNEFDISISISCSSKIEIIKVIGYAFYLLQAMGLLTLPCEERKLSISHELSELSKNYGSIIKKYNGINIDNIIGGKDE